MYPVTLMNGAPDSPESTTPLSLTHLVVVAALPAPRGDWINTRAAAARSHLHSIEMPPPARTWWVRLTRVGFTVAFHTTLDKAAPPRCRRGRRRRLL